MNSENRTTGLSSNTGVVHASWATLAETNNSVNRDLANGRRREVLKLLSCVGFACVVPTSTIVEPIFSHPNLTQNKSEISRTIEAVTLAPDQVDFDVRESYPLVRRVFGGTITQTARFYGVSRKTLYQWLGSDDTPRIRDKQLHRSQDLLRVARYAESTHGEVGKLSSQRIGHHTLIELLCGRELDTHEIISWLDSALSLKPDSDTPQGRAPLAERLAKTGAKTPPGEGELDLLV